MADPKSFVPDSFIPDEEEPRIGGLPIAGEEPAPERSIGDLLMRFLESDAAMATIPPAAGLSVAAGRRIPSLFHALGGGRGKYTAKVGEAVGKAAPEFAPAKPGAGGLMEATRASGPKALSAAREAEELAFLGQTREVPQARELLTSIKGLGPRGHAASGLPKDSPAASAARAERREAVESLRRLLSPDQLKAFEAMQGRYRAGKSVERLFKSGGGDPFKGGGLNPRLLQERANAMMGRLPPELAEVIGRGTPGQVDWRIPPGALYPLIQGLGIGGAGAGAYGLSRLLQGE